jgi:SAM-dependent methyltransferase
MSMIDCPACGLCCSSTTNSVQWCRACGHRWLEQSEDEHRAGETGRFTGDYAGYRPDARYLAATSNIVRNELSRRVAPPAAMLDVGCGAGDLMMVAHRLGYAVEGIDISEASAEICRARQLNARVADFLACDFDREFDLITMWDVVAHLRNPAAFFDRARSLLSERGALFVKTPGFGDLSVRLASQWPQLAGALLGAPSHVQYFDRESLAALLSRTNFAPEWVSAGRGRTPSAGGSLRRRFGRRMRTAIALMSGDANIYLVAHPLR